MVDMIARCDDLAAEHGALDALVDGLDEAGWDRPTPAEGCSVRDHIAHLAYGCPARWALSTVHGPIPFKVSRLDGRVVTVTPEFEEVRRIARATGLPVREVLDCARAEGRRRVDP